MKANQQPLISLIANLIAKEPFEVDGFKWAARLQPFYCETLAICPRTLRNWIAKPPFVRLVKQIDGRPVTLLRIGDAPPKDAKEYARILRRVWEDADWPDKPVKPLTNDQRQCLWGFCKDVMALNEIVAFAPDPGQFAKEAFKHALQRWQFVAGAMKIEAQSRPGYKWRYYTYPTIPAIRSFWRAVVNAYVTTLQAEAGLTVKELNQCAAILVATDPLAEPPALLMAAE